MHELPPLLERLVAPIAPVQRFYPQEPVVLREQRKVAAAPDVCPSVVFRPPLPHQNISRANGLSRRFFKAQVLWELVAARILR